MLMLNTFNTRHEFSAYAETAQAISGFTKMACNIEEYDTNGNYDNATYRFTAPVDGLYSFKGMMELAGLASTNRYIVTLYKNGAEFKRGVDSSYASNTNGGGVVSADIILDAGDYVELYGYCNVSRNLANVNIGYANYFQGHLIKRF